MGKDLNNEGRRFTTSSAVLPLAKSANVSQQITQGGPMKVWKLLNKTIQLGGAIIVTTDPFFFLNRWKNVHLFKS